MSMELWDPFAQAMSLPEAMNRLLQDSFIRPSGGPARRGAEGMTLPLDVHESEDGYTVQASLPGVKPDDVQIQIMGDTVTIRGELRDEREERRGEQAILRERRVGSFVRTLTLPAPVDADHAEATFENGVLTLRLPKSQQAKPRRIKVRSADGQQTQQGGARGATQTQQSGQGQMSPPSSGSAMGQDQAAGQGRTAAGQGASQTRGSGSPS